MDWTIHQMTDKYIVTELSVARESVTMYPVATVTSLPMKICSSYRPYFEVSILWKYIHHRESLKCAGSTSLSLARVSISRPGGTSATDVNSDEHESWSERGPRT